jgi:hypothetical protein
MLVSITATASDVITNVCLNIEKPVAGEPLQWHKIATTVNNDSNYKVYQNGIVKICAVENPLNAV